jgi:hypothetical protein
MWGTVLMLTVVAAVEPVRLGVTLLLISRPRPMVTLLAYWVGCLVASFPAVLVPLTVLHFAPMFRAFTQNLATAVAAATSSSTGRHVQLGMGVLALTMAALVAVRYAAHPRAQLAMTDGNPSTLVLQPSNPRTGNPMFWLLGRAGDASHQEGSAIWRLLGRAHNAWEGGSSWVAFLIGWASGPPPLELLFLVTAIVASGAAISTQVTAAVAFVIGMLAVVEIMLLSYLATPAKTEAVMQRLHDRVRANRRWLSVAIFTGLGGLWVFSGI